MTVQLAAGGRVTMTYDGDHMRRKREDATVAVKYIYDGAQVLIETEHGETTHARYNLAPFGYGDLLSQRRGGGGGGTWRWYHYDALGSTRALTTSSQTPVDTYLYDAWGTPKASTGSSVNPYRYVGKLGYVREDAINGYLLRRRYYRTGTGRFVSRDPVAVTGRGLYRYAAGQPLSHVDASGLQPGGPPVVRVPELPQWPPVVRVPILPPRVPSPAPPTPPPWRVPPGCDPDTYAPPGLRPPGEGPPPCLVVPPREWLPPIYTPIPGTPPIGVPPWNEWPSRYMPGVFLCDPDIWRYRACYNVCVASILWACARRGVNPVWCLDPALLFCMVECGPVSRGEPPVDLWPVPWWPKFPPWWPAPL